VSEAILSLQGVSKRFVRRPSLGERIAAALGAGSRPSVVHAVDRVDLEVAEGEVLGLVGESGCGKSTLGRIAAGIFAADGGRALFRGQPIAQGSGLSVRKATTRIQTVFQDPFASLNPRQRVGELVGEGPLVHGLVGRAAAAAYVAEIFRQVGLDAAFAGRYPHQFSGGQRQRIAIARALAMKPEFLVCDEAVASLDVSIQAQVLNLFMDLRRQLGLTYLFISHDLGVVKHISDRVAIMYLGRIVELAPTTALFAAPSHPYTQALLAAVPKLSERRRRIVPVKGEVPSASAPPAGCHFHPRCPHALPRCRVESPPLREVAPGRMSACHLNA
jgi:peptide/nickel transport system ATP-binding protein